MRVSGQTEITQSRLHSRLCASELQKRQFHQPIFNCKPAACLGKVDRVRNTRRWCLPAVCPSLHFKLVLVDIKPKLEPFFDVHSDDTLHLLVVVCVFALSSKSFSNPTCLRILHFCWPYWHSSILRIQLMQRVLNRRRIICCITSIRRYI